MLNSEEYSRTLGRRYGGIEGSFLGYTDVGYINAPKNTMHTFNQAYSESAILGNNYTFSILATYVGAKPTGVELYAFGSEYYTPLTGVESMQEGKWTRLTLTRSPIHDHFTGNHHMHVFTFDGSPSKVYFAYAKVEKGNKATDWTPAPEDVDAAIDVVSSELTEFKETTASKDSAQTVINNQALSRIGNAEGKITTLQNTSVTKDKAQSTHTIKTQAIAGGKRALAGIAVGAMANETTAESQVIVMADKFGVVKDAGDSTVKPMLTVVNNQVAVNGDLIADGTILGQHIKANQTISAPIINGGSLNINNRFKVDQFGNTTIQSSAGNTGLKITDEKIEVYDAAGRLRVRLGKLS